ncbi:hypothetical protein PR048_007314 [Dryococelus australis]|uniref:Uncharacterized protein n=1 Tax=Dryococelus australis TaxID=614101 RepID=A0ABQ9ID91_9NEOP|nr:hypothetical protein PR048_007314 [Dryococelus australis]
MRVTEVSMEQRWNERLRETGDPRENPPTSDIIRHDSHMRKFMQRHILDAMARHSSLRHTYKSSRLANVVWKAFPIWRRRARYNDTACFLMKRQGGGKLDIPEKARRPAASSGTIPTCENPRVIRPGIEPGGVEVSAVCSYLAVNVYLTLSHKFLKLSSLADLPWRSGLVRSRSVVREVLGSNPSKGMGYGHTRQQNDASDSKRIETLLANQGQVANSPASRPANREPVSQHAEVWRHEKTRGRGGVVARLLAFHLDEQSSIPGFRHVGIVADDAAGWSAGFLGHLPLPPPLHSGTTLYTPRFTIIGSQDLDVRSRPNLHSPTWDGEKCHVCWSLCRCKGEDRHVVSLSDVEERCLLWNSSLKLFTLPWIAYTLGKGEVLAVEQYTQLVHFTVDSLYSG